MPQPPKADTTDERGTDRIEAAIADGELDATGGGIARAEPSKRCYWSGGKWLYDSSVRDEPKRLQKLETEYLKQVALHQRQEISPTARKNVHEGGFNRFALVNHD